MLSPQGELLALGQALREGGYAFTSVTPKTHELVLNKAENQAKDLRDVFGWNRVFEPEVLSPRLLQHAERAGILDTVGKKLRSKVRFATLHNQLFVHSSYPTHEADAVFFGPDSYRFCKLVDQALNPCKRLVDVGCGTGVGGLFASRQAQEVVLADVSAKALEFATINAALNGVAVQLESSDILASIADPIDAVIANPPYMLDAAGRTYRDGGGELGEGLALRIVREALARLEPGGTLILYTGSAIVAGEDVFLREMLPICQAAGVGFEYSEIDPDVFGEELSEPAYLNVERIAAVGLVIRMPADR